MESQAAQIGREKLAVMGHDAEGTGVPYLSWPPGIRLLHQMD